MNTYLCKSNVQNNQNLYKKKEVKPYEHFYALSVKYMLTDVPTSLLKWYVNFEFTIGQMNTFVSLRFNRVRPGIFQPLIISLNVVIVFIFLKISLRGVPNIYKQIQKVTVNSLYFC